MTVFEKIIDRFSFYKYHFSFCVLLQEFLSDRPQKTTSRRWPYYVSHIHSWPESWLEKRYRTFHWAHHWHNSLISNIDKSVPHLNFTWNEHVSDDKLKKIDFAGFNFILWNVLLDHLFDIQDQDWPILGVPSSQVIYSCFLKLLYKNTKCFSMFELTEISLFLSKYSMYWAMSLIVFLLS